VALTLPSVPEPPQIYALAGLVGIAALGVALIVLALGTSAWLVGADLSLGYDETGASFAFAPKPKPVPVTVAPPPTVPRDDEEEE